MATWDPTEYDKQWTEMAAAGKDPHGEVAFIQRLIHRRQLPESLSILDAGCGTGRVAVELDRRGYAAQGTDVDADMLGEARAKAAHLTWTQADLVRLNLGSTFDLIVLAGNVILFVDPADQPLVAGSLRTNTADRGLVLAGMQLAREDGRHVAVAQWDNWMTAAGFELVERFANWDEGPWNTSSDYVVSLHRLDQVANV
jgi:SAM-dependent methyltransferase